MITKFRNRTVALFSGASERITALIVSLSGALCLPQGLQQVQLMASGLMRKR